MPEPIVSTYLAYLVLSVLLTAWVARTLHRSGRVFLVDVYRGNAELADSVNRLLAVGFYLVNLGFIAWALSTRAGVASARDAIELVSQKLGAVLAMLGAMHFVVLWVLGRVRAGAAQRERLAAGRSGWLPLGQAGASTRAASGE